MKKGLWLLGGLGIGAGLMYVFDPTYGKRRRSRARHRIGVARHQMGNVLEETAQSVRHWAQHAADVAPSWPVRRAGTHRLRPASQGWRSRRQLIDKGLLVLGCLGLGAVYMAMINAGSSSQQATADAAAKTMRDVYDWTCGVVSGVGSWLQKEDGSKNASVTSVS